MGKNILKTTDKKLNNDIKKIFMLSWPIMIGMILQSFLGTVDTYFIAKLGTNEAAAAALSNSASSVIFVISTLVSAGTIALVSRSYGEGDMEAVRSFSGQSFTLSLIFGIILSIICFLNTGNIIKLIFNPEPNVAALTEKYLSVVFIGTIFVFLNSVLRTILQSLGDTLTPLIIFGISNLINAILDPLFMFTFHLGIAGAAIATVISMVFSCIAITIVLIRKIYDSSLNKFIRSMKLQLNNSIRILKIGGWACLQQVARPITGMFMFSLVYTVGGREGTAAFGIGGQLFNYTFIFLVGLSTAISIMVGQSLGRGDINGCDKIIKEGLKLAGYNMILFSIPYLIFPANIMSFFINDPLVIRTGAEYLRIVYVGLIFVVYTTIYGGAFQGSGDTFPPMISSIVANVVLKLPIAYILASTLNMGTNGVWAAVSLSVVIEAVIIIVYFKTNRWKEKII
ncbi:MATE family efflux transporter [Clostridium sp. FP2]|uniref:MATE family efflux transporter n=1 Tax=Clostridium TaxID=1485 RepID=UPI0013E968D9|nr:MULTISPECIES: MATE family efflux transporter [Clostridium]MBW9157299.1 MATE family efflux transporter [Clostridium tagluense]MBZ9623434.1 MATE family efflux transporter [Clostridium sp. FP2]WLC67600.1 MATE family efflux transporter [Clostridium tagluense]